MARSVLQYLNKFLKGVKEHHIFVKMMMMIISPFGQFGLRQCAFVGALLKGMRRVHINRVCFHRTSLLDIEESRHFVKKQEKKNKLVWPTWALGALFRGARHIHINHV